MSDEPILAAQYLRMSTEHQQYSMLNQSAAIERYAQEHGFAVVKTYADAAKSGLVIKQRAGLRALLADVVARTAEYKVILVYDVSRWGRFQDNDESAFYEFICKQAGIPVRYCAETFENDGTLPSMIIKALKRSMAGEYSRELSVKVFEGQKRVAQLGYKIGGNPGYALRRMMVSREGKHKQILGQGEQKSLATDRVTLVPGPPEEVECVREIFRLFTMLHWPATHIAAELNRRGIKALNGHQWWYWNIYGILHHPKYAGWAIYGRTSQKLCTPSIHVPEQHWIAVKAFEPIIDQNTFDAAQSLFLKRNPWRLSDEKLLEPLRRLLSEKGYLDIKLIRTSPGVFSYCTYKSRFGGLRRIYELLDYQCEGRFVRSDCRLRILAIRNELLRALAAIPEVKSIIRRGYKRALVRLQDRSMISVITCRSEVRRTGLRWILDQPADEKRYLTLLSLLDESNEKIQSFYLVPRMGRKKKRIVLSKDHEWLTRGRPVASLGELGTTAKTVRSARGSHIVP